MLKSNFISRGKNLFVFSQLKFFLGFSPGLQQRLVRVWGVKNIQMGYLLTLLTWFRQSWFWYLFLKNCFPSQFLGCFFFIYLFLGFSPGCILGGWGEMHVLGGFFSSLVQLASHDSWCPGTKCERSMWDWAKEPLAAGRERRGRRWMHRTIFRHTEVAHLTWFIHIQDSPLAPSLRNYRYIGAADFFMCVFGIW